MVGHDYGLLTLEEKAWLRYHTDVVWAGSANHRNWQFAVAFEEVLILYSTDPQLKPVFEGYRATLKDIMSGLIK